MAVSDLREAFNLVAAPRYTCQQALLDYERADGAEWQILSFSGRGQDGNGFEIKSDRIGPSGDLVVAARETAQRLLDQKQHLT
jgi:hypothetical protein